MKEAINVFWFRRDLRLNDNAGLFHALESGKPVLLIFIFDTQILEKLPKDDPRVSFIYQTLQNIKLNLQVNYNSDIVLYHGKPIEVYDELTATYNINTVFTNRDYEPYGIRRDAEIAEFLDHKAISFKTFKDHVIFEKNEIVKSDGKPYLVYTPYMKKWKSQFHNKDQKFYDNYELLHNTKKNIQQTELTLNDIGFELSNQKIADYEISSSLIQDYAVTRNFPAKDNTSRLGPHLRFGTVSVREIMKKAISESNEIFWQELIWREFFIQIFWHFPETIKSSFKPKYERIQWRNNEKEFELWCHGKTGYPLVDAGMNQLNQTGFMHNRVRMVVGSFLCKHLLIDWRWGEAYFAEKLHDYEMASNIGNWQWVAGCGVDAAPYFRIFNPTTQIEKFDKKLEYIKQWVPDFQELNYPKPLVNHKDARERCLKTYKEALA